MFTMEATEDTNMVDETISPDTLDITPTEPVNGQSSNKATDGAAKGKSTAKALPGSMAAPANPNHPPPKTDKPRPHVCTTCMRSFARLEHLKRHERSHTKEKPFECPECTRCFARRDLLLRHQQKLHSTTTPSSRPRGTRRESAAGVTTGRVRKNSVASATNSTTTRPRANTLSHIDTATLGMLANSNQNFSRNFTPSHSHHNSFSGVPNIGGFQYRGIAAGQHVGLPKLETHGLPIDLSGGLRTAPPFGGFGAEVGMDSFAFAQGNTNTINPHFLHRYGTTGSGIDGPASPFQHMFNNLAIPGSGMEDENNFDWMAQGFEDQMSFANANENAIDDSSPSAMTTDSPAPTTELMLDGSTNTMQNIQTSTASMWQHPIMQQFQIMNSPAHADFPISTFTEMMPAPAGTISPKSLLAQNGQALDMNFPTPPEMSGLDPSAHIQGFATAFHLPIGRHGGASTASTASHDSSLRQSSVTTVSGDLVTEHTRNVIIAGLTQATGFGHRQHSQPSTSSPLSPGSNGRTKSFNINNFPSTSELQRYVSAYLKCFHPHLPFLHIPSLTFETPDYTTPLRTFAPHLQFGQKAVAGGGCCLILSIAAIGALYEHELPVSKELFECAKRLINSYLEERRKSNLNKSQFPPGLPIEPEDTPLWLIQAMMLNVIYGHNCGDKTAAEIASTHCAALVGLTRGAELTRPYPGFMMGDMANSVHQNLHVGAMTVNCWNGMVSEPDDSDWMEWKTTEERKRTCYAVFILSSLLVSAYNHAPALTNSEIRLDLPCDEELWTAENSHAWRALGGAAIAESRSVGFGAALGHLLTAAQRKQRRDSMAGGISTDMSESELKPSTFGCLVLINALHNYIWETRQRHLGKQWTIQETEQMHAHIEPALRAWQAAWASNPTHSLERPNPFGAGPLSADSIPLLDLAYVRLFVNLGRSKDAFWDRDYDTMAKELAKGTECFTGTNGGSTPKNDLSHIQSRTSEPSRRGSGIELDTVKEDPQAAEPEQFPANDPEELQDRAAKYSRRERHLRKAAFYAADSLSMSDKLGFGVPENAFRELPSQSAMCSFDCAQVLAEWASTVQERVGPYVGLLGEDEMDLLQVPGILLLEDEDRKLLEKIGEITQSAEHILGGGAGIPGAQEGGYGSKILILTAHMLDKAAVWPITKLMAQSLETQAVHMKERAKSSVAGRA